MLSLVACRFLFRLMRRCFLGRWICLLVSERFRLEWKCRLFGYNTARIARSKLCSCVSAWLGVFASNAGEYTKSDRSLLSCQKVTQYSTSEIGDAPLYNSCSLPIHVMITRPMPAPTKCKSGLPRITGTCLGWWKQTFQLRLWSLVWFQMRATSCHLTSSKSVWKSTPKCTWMCWRVWWSPGAIRWPVADPGCGSRTRHRPTSPKRPRLGFRRSANSLCPSLTGPLLPRPEPAELHRLVIRREHHQHDLPQHQSQPDRRHPPSIRRALAGACGKGMLPVPDPYRGGHWGWRQLRWIDVSSTT